MLQGFVNCRLRLRHIAKCCRDDRCVVAAVFCFHDHFTDDTQRALRAHKQWRQVKRTIFAFDFGDSPKSGCAFFTAFDGVDDLLIVLQQVIHLTINLAL